MKSRLEDYEDLAMKANENPMLLGRVIGKIEITDGEVIDCCKDLIEEKTDLSLGEWKSRNGSWYYAPRHDLRDSASLVDTDYQRVQEFEKDSPERIQERKDKLKRYAGVTGLRPVIKGSKTSLTGCMVVRRSVVEPNPDQIYCKDGLYGNYDRLKDTWEFRLCMRLRERTGAKCIDDHARLVFLYTALRNEKRAEDRVRAMMNPVQEAQEEPQPTMPKELPKMFERKAIQKILDATDEVERDGNLFRWKGEQWAFVMYATLICDTFNLHYKGGYRWRDFADAFQEDRSKINSWKSSAITLRDEGDSKKTAKKREFMRIVNRYKPRP